MQRTTVYTSPVDGAIVQQILTDDGVKLGYITGGGRRRPKWSGEAQRDLRRATIGLCDTADEAVAAVETAWGNLDKTLTLVEGRWEYR